MNTNQISLMSLFQVGAHRGNRKSKLNPRLRSKVHSFTKGLCQIDLANTNTAIEASAEILKKLGAKKKQILIVGTSKHISPLVVATSTQFAMPMPYVNNRWLGGTLTNWTTVRKTLKDKEKKEKIVSNQDFFNKLARNEQLGIQRQLDKLKTIFDGLTPLKTNRPGAIIVLDADENKVSIREAQNLGVPVIALTNTSTVFLPNNLTSTICMNTNSTKALELVLEYLVGAYNSGVEAAAAAQIAQTPIIKEEKKQETKKPM
jgi:small subunit ribosomal protein S2